MNFTKIADELDPDAAVPVRRLHDEGPPPALHGQLQLLLVSGQYEGLGVKIELGLSEPFLHPLVSLPQTVLPADGEQSGELIDFHLQYLNIIKSYRNQRSKTPPQR